MSHQAGIDPIDDAGIDVSQRERRQLSEVREGVAASQGGRRAVIDPKAPPQDWIGPRVYAVKWLPYRHYGVMVKIADKYRRARTATFSECSPIRRAPAKQL